MTISVDNFVAYRKEHFDRDTTYWQRKMAHVLATEDRCVFIGCSDGWGGQSTLILDWVQYVHSEDAFYHPMLVGSGALGRAWKRRAPFARWVTSREDVPADFAGQVIVDDVPMREVRAA